MTIDLTEPLIPLTQVPRLSFIPRRRAGKKLNAATAFRWASSGIRGVRLEVVRFGGTLCTTKAALLAFFRSLATTNHGVPSPMPRTPRQQQRGCDRATKELEKIGI
jgi:hypothetical protein